MRKQIASRPLSSEDFRKGVIYQALNTRHNNLVKVYVTIYNDQGQVATVPSKDGWTLPNAPVDGPLEIMAKRLAVGTVHTEVSVPTYVASFQQNNWAYRGESIQTIGTLFTCKVLWGNTNLKDVLWVEPDTINALTQ